MSLAGPVVDRLVGRPPSARPALARPALLPVLSPVAVAAGFEIGMLLRCARTGSGGYGPGAAVPTTMEFSRADAASRLVTLLDRLGYPARRDDYAAGGRHRYTLHRVICADLDAPALAQAWCAGYRRLCAPVPYHAAPQRLQRADLAGAAWRAALLVGGVRGRGGPLAVRVAGRELAVVLVRAARLLGAPVTLRPVTLRGSGERSLVEVAPGPAEVLLRELATRPDP